MSRRFTVISTYGSDGVVRVDQVRAGDWCGAVRAAAVNACWEAGADTEYDRRFLLGDLELVAVLPGWQKNQVESQCTSAFIDNLAAHDLLMQP